MVVQPFPNGTMLTIHFFLCRHNPLNLAGIEAMRELLPHIPAVAVFDTSFHSTLPEKASTYPIPEEYRLAGLRKFGFHAASVKYVCGKAISVLRKLFPNSTVASLNMIVCHLGNGASVTAVSNTQSIETTVGFSPLSGLMMGTRAGSVDQAIVLHAVQHLNKSVDEVLDDLNQNSGLKAMVYPNPSFDLRDLLKRSREDDKAALAVDIFVYRLAQHIASSIDALKGSWTPSSLQEGLESTRQRCMLQLKSILHIELDPERNEVGGKGPAGVLTPDGDWPVVLDIATDEEAMIARECYRLIPHHEIPSICKKRSSSIWLPSSD
jgi:acetate kinase